MNLGPVWMCPVERRNPIGASFCSYVSATLYRAGPAARGHRKGCVHLRIGAKVAPPLTRNLRLGLRLAIYWVADGVTIHTELGNPSDRGGSWPARGPHDRHAQTLRLLSGRSPPCTCHRQAPASVLVQLNATWRRCAMRCCRTCWQGGACSRCRGSHVRGAPVRGRGRHGRSGRCGEWWSWHESMSIKLHRLSRRYDHVSNGPNHRVIGSQHF